MSRVTIDNIQHDASGLDNMSWAEITELYQIEVVPRKMVEMIIEKCKKNEEALRPHYGDSYSNGLDTAYMIIRDYAESLLEQFEKE